MEIIKASKVHKLTAGAIIVAISLNANAQTAATTNDKVLGEMRVVAERADRVSSGATNMDIPLKETPQSITVIKSEDMQDFAASSINEALQLSTGIIVDAWETNRTTYTARGFDIANTQIDGIGMPNGWGIVSGAIDTFGYDKIEVIRGANGLLTGVGNAAGTINFVRKRPTNEPQGSVNVRYGSWGKKRIEADYSTPISEDRRWATRVVAAREEGDSHLRSLHNERTFFYGVIDGQIGDNGVLSVGYSHQQDNTKGNMWGALTFMNNNGTQADWPTDSSTTQDWTKWNTNMQTAFVDYTHQLNTNWQLKFSYNYRNIGTDTKLFYTYLMGAGLVPGTGAGLAGYAWRGEDARKEHLGEVSLNGTYSLFGRQHEAVVGLGWAKSHFAADDYKGANCGLNLCVFIPMASFPFPGNAVPEPIWGTKSPYSGVNEKRKRAFGSTRLSLSDNLKAILGFNYAQYHRDGVNSGLVFDQTEGKTSPYAGLTYDFTDSILGYVSYSDIYLPQSQVDINNQYLDPSKGTNVEAGLKMEWLDKRLLTTVALFQAKQHGLATPTGTFNAFGQSVYTPVDVNSKGVELEAVGKLGDYTDVILGYTTLKLSGQNGADVYKWVPRQTANLMVRARMPSNPDISMGVSGRWQSEISNVESSGFTVRQGSYAVLNAYAAWQFHPQASLRFNVNNLTNEKYINTLRYAGYYGAPRNYQATLNYKF